MDGKENSGCGCNYVKTFREYQSYPTMQECHNYKMNNSTMDEYPMDDFNSEGELYNENSLDSMPLGMAYVPWQKWNCVYNANQGIQAGTIFPELVLPFTGKKCDSGMRGDGQWK